MAKRFANHPGAKPASAEALHFAPEEDRNPTLRGLPLLVASAVYVLFHSVLTFCFGILFHIPGVPAPHPNIARQDNLH